MKFYEAVKAGSMNYHIAADSTGHTCSFCGTEKITVGVLRQTVRIHVGKRIIPINITTCQACVNKQHDLYATSPLTVVGGEALLAEAQAKGESFFNDRD